MLIRTLSGIAFLLVVLLVLFVSGLNGVKVAAMLIVMLGGYELCRMYKLKWATTSLIVLLVALTSVSWYFYLPFLALKVIVFLTWVILVPFILLKKLTYRNPFYLILLALVIFCPFFYAICWFYAVFGPWQLLSLMAIAFVADTTAYLGGRAFGRHKLAPLISPNKTLEGVLVGLFAVIVYLYLLKFLGAVIYLNNYFEPLKMGVILGSISILGDLFESWLKRVAGVKDSGKILPGHGGVFDRFDSLFALIPVALLLIS